MLPARRLAVGQALLLARSSIRPAAAIPSSRFHTSRLAGFPIPTSSDDVTGMDSKNTAGQGMNEKGIGNRNTPNEHNPTNFTSNAGRASQSTPVTPSTPSSTPPPPTSSPAYDPATSPLNPTTDGDVKEAVKKTARKAKAKAHNAADSLSESARHSAAGARVGYEQTKEDVKHAVNRGKARVKAVVRDHEAANSLDANDTVVAHSRPSHTHGRHGREPYTNQVVGDTAPPMNLDADAMKARARDAAASVKAGLSSVVEGVKTVASSVADSLKSGQARASAAKESTSERMAKFGERMEAKFEKIGEDMMKSGEAIERRNREPDPAYPEPLPLDDVAHMPNPANPNDVLPGTGPKDSKRNEPITDSRDRGQFPG